VPQNRDDELRDLLEPWRGRDDNSGRLSAVDVPPGVDCASVRAALLRAGEQGRVDFEVGALVKAHRACLC